MSLAPIFDPIQYLFNGNFWEVFNKKFSSYTKGRVVDLACGTGEMRRWIKPKLYQGVDLNASYINYAKQRFEENNTTFVAGDITKFSPETTLDTALLVSAVHHLTDEQLKKAFKNLRRNKVKNLIVVDGYPKRLFAPLLAWLDAVLAGGEYFRDENEMANLVEPFYKIKSKGVFYAKRSFYNYPYVIALLPSYSNNPQTKRQGLVHNKQQFKA